MISMLLPKIPVGPSSRKPLLNSSNFFRDRLKRVALLLSMLEVEVFAHSSHTDYAARQPQ